MGPYLKFQRQRILLVTVGSLLANAAFVASWVWSKWSLTQPASDGRSSLMRKPPLVQTAEVAQQAITVRKPFSGVLKASQAVDVIADGQGRVSEVFFTIGQKVKKGDILIQLDDRAARAECEGLQAKMLHAKALYLSYKKLEGIRSRLEIEEKKTSWQMAEAELKRAQLILSYSQIKAPFDGFIGDVMVNTGAMIDPRQVVTRLVNDQTLYVYFDVPEADAVGLRKGQLVEVAMPDEQAVPEEAKILGLQPYSDASSHTVRVQAVLQNPEQRFRDGSYAQVTANVASNEDALVVPRECILTEGKQDFVFVLAPGQGVPKVMKVPVIVGMKQGGVVEIVDGLKLGDTVVTDPVDMLVDGLPVRLEGAAG